MRGELRKWEEGGREGGVRGVGDREGRGEEGKGEIEILGIYR